MQWPRLDAAYTVELAGVKLTTPQGFEWLVDVRHLEPDQLDRLQTGLKVRTRPHSQQHFLYFGERVWSVYPHEGFSEIR